jgi:hypothetical protein
MTEDQSCNPLNQDAPDDGGLALTRATYDLIRACFNDEIAWNLEGAVPTVRRRPLDELSD